MGFSAKRLSRPEGDLVMIEIRLFDGGHLFRNFLTEKQWKLFIQASGEDVFALGETIPFSSSRLVG